MLAYSTFCYTHNPLSSILATQWHFMSVHMGRHKRADPICDMCIPSSETLGIATSPPGLVPGLLLAHTSIHRSVGMSACTFLALYDAVLESIHQFKLRTCYARTRATAIMSWHSMKWHEVGRCALYAFLFPEIFPSSVKFCVLQ